MTHHPLAQRRLRRQQLTRPITVGVLLLMWVSMAVALDAQSSPHSWSLMVPPPLVGWPFADYEAPLSTWTLLEAFDTAGPCKTKRRLLVKEAGRDAEAAAQARDDWRQRRSVRAELLEPAANHATLSRAQCVAVGDPRLAQVAPNWMLLLPPPRSNPPVVDIAAPLGQWFSLGRYDSRLSCRVAQQALPEHMGLGPAPRRPSSDPPGQPGSDHKSLQRLVLERSQCVEVTDRRLAPTPER
jgi:hypothetical protein